MFEDERVVSLAPTEITFLPEASMVMVPALPEGKPLFPAAKKIAVPWRESTRREGIGETNHVVVEILIDTVARVVSVAAKWRSPRIGEDVGATIAQDRVLVGDRGAVQDIVRVTNVQKSDSCSESDAIVDSTVCGEEERLSQ
jgi:hypothetical protein